MDIHITFYPFSLGTASLELQLELGQAGWTPLPCHVLARAVSGLIEASERVKGQQRLLQHAFKTGKHILQESFQTSSFKPSQFQADLHVLSEFVSQSRQFSTSPGKDPSDVEAELENQEPMNLADSTLAPLNLTRNNKFLASSRLMRSLSGPPGLPLPHPPPPAAAAASKDPLSSGFHSTFQAPDLASVLDRTLQQAERKMHSHHTSTAAASNGTNNNTSNTNGVPSTRNSMKHGIQGWSGTALYPTLSYDPLLESPPLIESRLRQDPSPLGERYGGEDYWKSSEAGRLFRSSRRLMVTKPLVPRGPGSGAFFDPGSEWILQHHQRLDRNKKKSSSSSTWNQEIEGTSTSFGQTGLPAVSREVVKEGYTLPLILEGVPAVNSVLTQVPGKLKPKDLKAAIAKTREERERRQREQENLRASMSGQEGNETEDNNGTKRNNKRKSLTGALDYRMILAEERNFFKSENVEQENASCSGASEDPFSRQLWEMAFQADLDEVSRQETEKQFRISETFLGAELLKPEEIEEIHRQRKMTKYHEKRSQWRKVQSRRFNFQASCPSLNLKPTSEFLSFAPPSSLILSPLKSLLNLSLTQRVNTYLTPHFDSNRNDLWSKRLNTLRKFLSLVGKFLLTGRVTTRLRKIAAFFATQGIHTKGEARLFIEEENLKYKSTSGSGSTSDKKSSKSKSLLAPSITANNGDKESTLTAPEASWNSVVDMIFSQEDPRLVERSQWEQVLQVCPFFLPEQVGSNRILFPRWVVEESSERWIPPATSSSLDQTPQFDDRSYHAMKIQPEYERMKYGDLTLPIMPLYFPSGKEVPRRNGAYEEAAGRPPADSSWTGGECKLSFASLTPFVESWVDYSLFTSPPPLTQEKEKETPLEHGESSNHTSTIMTVKSMDGGPKDTDKEELEKEKEEGVIAILGQPPSELPFAMPPPSWMDTNPLWSEGDLDYFSLRQEHRLFSSPPSFTEMDGDWRLRGHGQGLPWPEDRSLRQR